MRYTILALVALLAIHSTQSALTHMEFNKAYEPQLYGQVAMNGDNIKDMYLEFLQTYKGVPRDQVNNHMERVWIFQENVRDIVEHNQDPTRTWDMGINEYSDMTEQEFLDYFRLNDDGAEQKCSATERPKQDTYEESPAAYDWRDHDGVTPVKNQGSCGSCWTFSTVGGLESHYKIKYGKEKYFAEQQLVDCAGDYDCYGCMGGLPSYAFNYIRDHGLTDEDHYEYHARDETCHYVTSEEVVHTTGPFNITARDEDQMQEKLYSAGPISCSFRVQGDFQKYKNGTYSADNCKNGEMDINHAVLCVGYGHDDSADMDFWSVKNSWGTQWGDEGFFQIQKGVNMCGIGVCNSFPENVEDTTTFTVSSYLKRGLE